MGTKVAVSCVGTVGSVMREPCILSLSFSDREPLDSGLNKSRIVDDSEGLSWSDLTEVLFSAELLYCMDVLISCSSLFFRLSL